MYNAIMYAMQLSLAVYSLFNEKVRRMRKGEREAFSVLREKTDPEAKYIWFHAASLGEFEQGRPLIEQIRKDYPEYKILLTLCFIVHSSHKRELFQALRQTNVA